MSVDLSQVVSVKSHIQILAASVSDIPQFKRLSSEALELVEALQAGEISVSEYTELKNDLVNLNKINSTMTDLDNKQRLYEAATSLLNLLNIVMKFV